ncbi:tRNA (guanine-N1)-methyltransferase [Clostridium sp. SYSU_GA19001]|uniref:tRNA (guanine-N1)-methyltransferase n=1 Tax=Clostridium caldaquaticum TaxID=2940653 RepID=UPI002076F31B|nr:tRNA (guanine-N1)-methyltransferase [Clostridium caldaquaticum]MCM8709775.1 tRNA (guanine-N1)-methyltransferase [Clostridium caldaquaticum]
MGKPSIFSREYERRMKKRKLKMILFVSFLVIVGIFYFTGSSFKNIVKSKINSYKSFKFFNSNNEAEKNINSENETTTNDESNKPAPQEKIEEKFYDVTLNNEIKIKAVYEHIDGMNKFKYINTDNQAITFNINPSGTGMVLYDSKSQSIWFLDINGKLEDVSALSYTSSNSKTYKRETILAKRADYIWCTSPKFIDDENIAYFSQLPYIRKTNKKYLWFVNVKNKDRDRNINVGGENIKFGNNTDKGLEVIMDDGSIRFISIQNGSIAVSK